MELDFSKPEKADSETGELLQRGPEEFERDQVSLNEEEILQELYNAATILKDKFSWTKNVSITNKAEEAGKFREAWINDERYDPEFGYSSFRWMPETSIMLLSALNEECRKIDKLTLKEYNAKEIGVEELRNLFRGIFEEFKLYAKLAATIEDREAWQQNCMKLWPMNKDSAMKSKRALINNDFESNRDEEQLHAEDMKKLWKAELDRIGVDYSIEIRNVNGCFNIPEEDTVVIAKGAREERLYPESEARILTMHELFHVVRTYNGKKVGEESGLPPILGMHTPFYDKTEEGGAIYREYATEVITPEQQKDYHLRAMAAYHTYEGADFYDVVERLVKLGCRPKRAFSLAARNREVLRHHIYMGGYYEEWQNREELWPLLIGKVNPDWAGKLKKEIEADGGMLEKPPVTEEDLFDYRFS